MATQDQILQSHLARAAWAREHTAVTYAPHKVNREDRADGTIILTSGYQLEEAVRSVGVWIDRWAKDTPDHVAVAERQGDGWRELTYAQLRDTVRRVGASLVGRGLGQGDTIAILSGNGLDHLILSLSAQYVGVPVVPIAEQYSLIPGAYPRLAYVIEKVVPKMAFVDDASRYAGALALPCLEGVEIVAAKTEGAPGAVTALSDLEKGDGSVDVDAAHAAVGPDSLAKIMFTSGSSSDPKGVLTTHKMLCVNQVQLRATMPLLGERPPVITDWLPWNHVFGGSHNVNMMLANGGTLNIDQGKPTAGAIGTTLKNLSERPGTLDFNVPIGFAMTVGAMEEDAELRKNYFRDLDLIFYAGASLPPEVWSGLENYSIAERGGLPLMISSWGLTETAPACLIVHEPIGRSGVIGVPVPGLVAKLLPNDEDRWEIRVKGPNVMTGYFQDPDKTAKAFDEEGFFITGDAVRFVDPSDASRGLTFDGRVSEDFKLITGTWVQAGMLRMNALKELTGLVQDVVICGHDRSEIGLFVFPAPARAKGTDTSDGALIAPELQAEIEARLREMNSKVSGSAKRITRAIILAEPPSVDGQEITDKGSLNINKILNRRASLLERLYDNEDPALIRV